MKIGPLKSAAGFTFLAVLIMIVIMGIMLGMVGQSWETTMKREREEELMFRGSQIRDAITRWYKPRAGQHVSTPLRDLKDLLKDPRSLSNVRYLRRLYTDPITGKEWNVIRDPQKGILGVASTSEETPMKQANFPEEFVTFEGKTKYKDWQFVYGTMPTAGSITLTPRKF